MGCPLDRRLTVIHIDGQAGLREVDRTSGRGSIGRGMLMEGIFTGHRRGGSEEQLLAPAAGSFHAPWETYHGPEHRPRPEPTPSRGERTMLYAKQ